MQRLRCSDMFCSRVFWIVFITIFVWEWCVFPR
jgi:hypothetical protein